MLSDSKILERMQSGDLRLLDPNAVDVTDLDFDRGQLQPVSIDLRLGDVGRGWAWKGRNGDEPLRWGLPPGGSALASTFEIVALSDRLAGKVEGKSTIARLFLHVEAAGLVDPGFRGQLTLELTNLSDELIVLTEGQRICQLCLFDVDGPVLRPYGSQRADGGGSHYQGQMGPTAARGLDDL
jgi:dCTP deaminase